MKVREWEANFNIGVQKLTLYLEEAPHVTKIEISERIDKEILEAFNERIAANKPKKGKKGKKKKKWD